MQILTQGLIKGEGNGCVLAVPTTRSLFQVAGDPARIKFRTKRDWPPETSTERLGLIQSLVASMWLVVL